MLTQLSAKSSNRKRNCAQMYAPTRALIVLLISLADQKIILVSFFFLFLYVKYTDSHLLMTFMPQVGNIIELRAYQIES